MKKLYVVFLLLPTIFTVKAQTSQPINGPTKEQTINFIKSELVGKTIGGPCFFARNDIHFLAGIEVSDIVIDLIDGKLQVKYTQNNIYRFEKISTSQHVDQSKKTYENAEVDLEKIESVSITISWNGDCAKNGNTDKMIHLVLRPVAGYKIESSIRDSKDFLIPINFYSTPDIDFKHEEHNKKIIQAFNHLRKLCGGPEPISFDGN